jgi:hypothetical protein
VVAEPLSRALDDVYAAIIAGHLDDLAGMAERITAALTNAGRLTASQLRNLQKQAARNAICLEAAMKGVRAAQRRVTELRTANTGHLTYNQKGERAALGMVLGTLRERI